MNFEPQKFFIGMIDFFSVLLPGALLTYVLKEAEGSLFSGLIEIPKDAAGWMAFLFLSYLLGHFIFLISSAADKFLYDPLKMRTRQEQSLRLVKGKDLSWKIIRGIAFCFFGKGVGSAVRYAEVLRNHYLDRLGASQAMNAFQWCKARLTLEKPEFIATIQRFEADSKFFRSLLVVLLVFFIMGVLVAYRAYPKQPTDIAKGAGIAIASFFLWLLAFWRYIEQRVKATNQAYGFVITLEAQQKEGFRFISPDPNKEPTHAGGVVYRKSGQWVEYLLVQAKDNSKEWVLPKGRIEPFETMPETAIREVREETGVWGHIRADLGGITYTVKGMIIHVRFYLMEVLEEHRPDEPERMPRWMTLAEVLKDAFIREESLELLKKTEKILSNHSNVKR
jgi:8-oxo-dGTP pyrophosphatase MutT (NUDIX family)